MDLDRVLSVLPDDFRRYCASAAGRMIFHGYYRLLGPDGSPPYTLADWNEPACWRFAWPSLEESYFCFGFSAWGDQYAFDLRAPDRGVIVLDAYEMSADPVADSFTELLEREMARLDRQPYDVGVLAAFDRFGALQWHEGLGLVPPLLLSETEDACEMVKMNMRSLMVVNGDVYTQLSRLPERVEISRVESFTDDEGRERIRLVAGPLGR